VERPTPRLWIWLAAALLAVGLALEIGWMLDRRSAARDSEQAVEQLAERLSAFNEVVPAPTAAVTAMIEVDLTTAGEAVASLRDQLTGRSERARFIETNEPPAQRADMFFEIARFGEAQRAAAREAGVVLRENEAFGFAAYAHSGPALVHVAQVHRQRLLAEYLLEQLWAARPHRFEGLERARPGESNPPEAPWVANEPGESDYFEIDPQVSARRAGLVRTEPMRVGFTGQTGALRTLLNRLADFDLPVLVRRVEVEPAVAALPAARDAGGRSRDVFAGVFGSPAGDASVSEAPVPLVAENFSRFTVTVEFIDWVNPPPDPEDER